MLCTLAIILMICRYVGLLLLLPPILIELAIRTKKPPQPTPEKRSHTSRWTEITRVTLP